MIDIAEIGRIAGAEVRGPDDAKIGTAGKVYVNDTTGEPAWVIVSTGLLGRSETFVPLRGASWDGEVLRLPYDKSLVKGAPHKDPDGHLTVEEEQELYGYFGVDAAVGDAVTRTDEPATQDAEAPETRYAEEPVAQSADEPVRDDAMTRSEEHLEVDTEQLETGRARLRKYVVTEEQTVTVPVSHEEVRVEREPITDDNRDAALAGEPITEAEHEVVLHEERPVVTTQAEPVERVRLGTETVTEEQRVTGEIRREQIELEDGEAVDGTEPRTG